MEGGKRRRGKKRLIKALSSIAYYIYEKLLEKEILKKPLPEHVAIIMDGNRRYARRMGLPAKEGHVYGVEATEKVIEWCFELGVKQLTLYAFSIENFERAEEEKRRLFELLEAEFKKISKDERIHKRGVRVRVIGNLELLPISVREAIIRAEEATARYGNARLYVAVAYSGRMEIVEAARKIGEEVKRGELDVEDITEEEISKHLYIGRDEGAAKVDVDLIIRTGGEKRLSNFIPWQAFGNECAVYFCAPFWPMFRRIDLLRAIRTYQQRMEEKERRSISRMLKIIRGTYGFPS
ncbi:MAG: polyprenyl diphosphate synthase [Candidatus Methanospirareceae archaeon]